ncbi:MAG: FAD-dependent oxidoreductase [Planctomycetota bacterium]|nr:FAD-dependent oxidoreductase [Planctomycetota bacterium]
MKQEKHICIVGGGIVGACAAYFLNRSGFRVTIVEADRFGYGCSRGNCGYVSPSHVLPIAVPGIVGNTMKSMLSRKSPFYIKPRVDLALWRWLFKFWRRCNRGDMLASARVKHALLQSSFSLYEKFMDEEQVQCDWEHRGLLFVYRDEEHFEHYGDTNRMIEKEFGVSAKPLPSRELVEFEPAIKPEIAGAWLYECDAHLRSDLLMASFAELLKSRGVEILEQTRFEEMVARTGDGKGVGGGRASAAKTSRGIIEADEFVLATGAWTPKLAREIGCSVPIQPGKGYSITMPRPALCPKIPMIFEQHRVAITPFESGYRIGSTMELAGYDSSINRARLDLLRESSELYLQDPHCDPVEMEWFGWRPLTYDDLPIIDRTPRWNNVLVAAGHGMLGLSMGMVSGKMIDEMMRGEKTHIDRNWVSFNRLA